MCGRLDLFLVGLVNDWVERTGYSCLISLLEGLCPRMGLLRVVVAMAAERQTTYTRRNTDVRLTTHQMMKCFGVWRMKPNCYANLRGIAEEVTLLLPSAQILQRLNSCLARNLMGNASCSRRMQHNPVLAPPPGYPNAQVAPLGQLPLYYHAGDNGNIPPDVRRPYYPQGLWPSNGQYFMNMQSGSVNPQEAVLPPILNPPVMEQKVVPIRNEVNVNKSTLRLEKDEENPGYYLVAFTFDAIIAGSICIFFNAKEGRDFSLIPMNRDLFEPVRIPFEKGLAQKFVQAPGTGVKLSAFEPSDLLEVKNDEIYPLLVRAETSEGDLSTGDAAQEAGAPLTKFVGAQTTSCLLEMKDNDYSVRVVKQIIWVEGMRYELQEIYGIETVDGGGGIDSSDFGKECVICLSEQRDTTVLPCRHMCMCSGCAKLLQQRTNRCPICRTPVIKLLEIEIPKRETAST